MELAPREPEPAALGGRFAAFGGGAGLAAVDDPPERGARMFSCLRNTPLDSDWDALLRAYYTEQRNR